MGMVFGGSGGFNPMALGRPDMMKGMAEAAKEMAKLKGVPVLTVTRMGSTGDGSPLPSAAEAPEAAQSQGPDMKEASNKAANNAAKDATLGRLGGLAGGLGGMGGFGKKKKAQPEEKPAEETKAEPAKPAGPAILMETTTESSGFSSATVDSAKLDVPAGFKQVEPELGRRKK